MTFDEIERKLPMGLHDARLERIEIDWHSQRASFDVRLNLTERKDPTRLGRITVTGLVFCSVDAPVIDPERGYEAIPEGGLWIDAGTGTGDPEAGRSLPRTPVGTFLQWIFIQSWNRFIHICGRDANFKWLEDPDPDADGN